MQFLLNSTHIEMGTGEERTCLQYMMETGAIEPSLGEWSSPLVIDQKPNGSGVYRFSQIEWGYRDRCLYDTQAY